MNTPPFPNWYVRRLTVGVVTVVVAVGLSARADMAIDFEKQIAPILERHCIRCHKGTEPEGGLDLTTRTGLLRGGESGAAFEAKQPDQSLLLEMVIGDDPAMPKNADPLNSDEIEVLRDWIRAGAPWADGRVLKAIAGDWWSLQPTTRPALPDHHHGLDSNPVDRFVGARLSDEQLQPSPPARRSTLIRRVYYDLIGLPPSPVAVESFVADDRPDGFERLVDRLLASPHYGERWARHWLDVVHYGDTHGYDKDKLRPNAWPYRDYVVRSFNEDKPYARFVHEQLAGDALWPDERDGIEGTGFIAAGPWDFIGHAEVPETKIDGRVARHTDRDDMVRTTMETFNSLTVGCAQCHDHKFDPVTMEHYYSLHAVFAAVDRADRHYDPDPVVAQRRQRLMDRKATLTKQSEAIDRMIHELAGPELKTIEDRIAKLTEAQQKNSKPRPEFGFHSQIVTKPNVEKWVQVDLGTPTTIEHVLIVGCHDDFNNIGAGFGYPVRFRIEAGNDPEFRSGVTTIVDRSKSDQRNPGVAPQSFPAGSVSARYIRVTATRLVNRLPKDYIFALAELMALTPDGRNAASGAVVTSLDSIEAPVRWRRTNLVDGYYYGKGQESNLTRITRLGDQRARILARVLTDELNTKLDANQRDTEQVDKQLASLPPRRRVYCGHVYTGGGAFRGRGGLGPREIRVLHRGQVTQPGELARPGTVPVVAAAGSHFVLADDHAEHDRRIALAEWITREDHPLTWRSIVNRIWLYHVGRGIVDSPNDFGRMGQLPSHPDLLDWLAVEFRDNGQSIKRLHRLIVASDTWQQSSRSHDNGARVDADNRLLWRQNRRRLDAESIRDTVLHLAGRLNTTMGGPGFRDFVLERPEHSPHYEYHKHDPNDATTHRRSIYRFLVRSQPQPFMDTLDCADPSQMVPKRNDTLSALQALALLNNRFMLFMSDQMAKRIERQSDRDPPDQVASAFRLTIGRTATSEELAALVEYAKQHGMPNTCRLILNLNEFAFVD